MRIQINTDSNIHSHSKLNQLVETTIEDSLKRFRERITRVEVHLSDVNSHKAGADDIRCVIEARVEGLQPVAVRHQAATVEQAVDGAAEKLERSLDSTLGKLSSQKRRQRPPAKQTPEAEE